MHLLGSDSKMASIMEGKKAYKLLCMFVAYSMYNSALAVYYNIAATFLTYHEDLYCLCRCDTIMAAACTRHFICVTILNFGVGKRS